MAAANEAIGTSKDSLYEPELKCITDPIQAAIKCTILRSQKQASGCKPHPVTLMELASLIWTLEMHCIFDIVEHHTIPPLTAMVVDLSSTQLMTSRA